MRETILLCLGHESHDWVYKNHSNRMICNICQKDIASHELWQAKELEQEAKGITKEYGSVLRNLSD